MSKDFYDVIIIGSGAAGAAAAWNLSNKGLKIICLEQGSYTNPDFYPKNKSDISDIHDYNYLPKYRNLISDYPINDKNSPISISNYNAVGGSTILYSGHFPRFHPSDFKTKTIDGVGEDWPLDYEDLEPFYNLNDKIMGISGLEGDPAYPPIKNLLPPIPLGNSGELIANAYEKLGWHWWPSYSAILTNTYEGRRACVNEGVCNSGCPHGSKSSVDVTYWPKAKSNGVRLQPNSRVISLELDNSENVKNVIYQNEKNEFVSITGSIFILACSGLGTPRLLLNSKSKSFSNGLANRSGLVGKNLMLHPLGYAEGLFENLSESYFGPQGCCILSQEFYKTNNNQNFKRGYTMQVLRGSGPLETALAMKKFKKFKFGNNFHSNFNERYGRNIPISVICEDLPEETNNIELDSNNLDSSGMPGVTINYKLSENTKKMMSHGITKAKTVLKEAGAKSVIAFGPVKNTGWHIMGTTKMGKDKNNSVVNEFGQTHDIKNLVIVDSSVFTTSAGVNPVSTIQALSLKISSDIINNPNKFSPQF